MSDPLPIAIVDDVRFDAHEESSGRHPECPERLVAAREGLFGVLPASQRRHLAPRQASEQELLSVHSADHLRTLERALAGGHGHIDADTFFSPGSREAAWLAAGGAADLARSLVSGESSCGVALLRPPGHHAEPGSAMGFCMLNNIAIAAHSALALGVPRVAIVDWDVHHGNGTQAAFYDDPRVLFISMHQYPFYPGTGAPAEVGRGRGLGTTINLALPSGCGVADYAEAMRRVVLPALADYAPELLLVSAGFDAHRADPLAGMRLDAACYGAMTAALLQAQNSAAGAGRVGFVLEGGYDLDALKTSTAALGRAVIGDAPRLPDDPPSSGGLRAIETTIRYAAPHWNSLS